MALKGFGIGLLSIAALAAFGYRVEAATDGASADSALVAQARSRMSQRRFDEAIEILRRYLRRHPKDTTAWNELGAAYYHTGQPRKALRFLKHVERTTSEKSYNYYYQGLCYLAGDLSERARDFLGFAALKFHDDYAGRAAFELGVLEYNAKNRSRAQQWLTTYVQRYPGGAYQAAAQRLLASLKEGRWLDGVEGVRKPDLEEALFKYNKLSLWQKPHYWFVQGGGRLSQENGQEPTPSGGLKASGNEDIAGLANAGIGIGPVKQGDTTAVFGYTYRQYWHTDRDRFDEWTSDLTDVRYFPLRADLLERHHQFHGDFRHDVSGLVYYGVYGRFDWGRIDSSLLPAPGNGLLRKSLKTSETQLLLPWIGTSYGSSNQRTMAYLYLRKEINEESPDYSNKSYDFTSGGGQPVVSLGASHAIDFPDEGISFNLDAFRYSFVYNDYWLDYKRQGIALGGTAELAPRWHATALLGYYRDDYVLPRLKQHPCGTQPESVDNGGFAGDPTPHLCNRVDTGLVFQGGVYWGWSQFQRFSTYFQVTQNQNAQQREFEDSRVTLQFMYTMAFPSVKRVERLIDRYGDTAFTKDSGAITRF